MLLNTVSEMMFLVSLKGISPDLVTYSTLMKAFIRARKFDKVFTALDLLQILPSHMTEMLKIRFYKVRSFIC